MSADANAQNPYLSGSFAPIADERCDAGLQVIGELPAELHGTYVRNGPNPRFEPRGRYHWFDGDGMLHAVQFKSGRASYQNRWVRTRGWKEEDAQGRALWTGLLEPVEHRQHQAPYKDTSNTDVVFHQGKLMTSWYLCGQPYVSDPLSLNTEGVAGFLGLSKERGPRQLSAHTKVDFNTGELMFFEYGPKPPFMSHGVVDQTGKLSSYTDVELPGPRLPHDMAITEHYSILMDLPVFLAEDALKQGRWKSQFFSDLPARFAILPRHGTGTQVRWFEAEPCYIYHVVNAWEEGEEVVMLACRVDKPIGQPRPEDGPFAQMMANLRVQARLVRYRFHLSTGKTREEPLDDRNTEFPTIDMRHQGRPTHRSYHVSIADSSTLRFDGLVAYATDTGRSDGYPFGPGRFGSEPAFAHRPGAEADDGYLITFVHDEQEGRSEVWVFDAANLPAGPLAKVLLPRRVPLGFHACWVPGDRL